jgi:hypothetical protein
MKFLPIGMRLLVAGQFIICLTLAVLAVTVFYAAFVIHYIVEYDMSTDYLTGPLAAVIFIMAITYGFLRGGLYHPVFDEKYRNWLATTPWTPRHPLPKGPVYLVWVDLIVIGMLTAIVYFIALTLSTPIWPYLIGPSVSFTLVVVLMWTSANAVVGQAIHVHAVLWVPVVIAASPLPPVVLVCCPFIMLAIAWDGVRRSLHRFPWKDCESPIKSQQNSNRSNSPVGWPYSTLLHPLKECRSTLNKAIMGALLLAAWVWSILGFIQEHDPKEGIEVFMVFVAVGSVIAAGVRLVCYSPVMCSRLCWGRRIATKRWIIPEHDVMFVAPLLMLLIGTAAPWVLHYLIGVSIAASCAITAGLVYLITKKMGPSIAELHLTGAHSKFGELHQSKEFITVGG